MKKIISIFASVALLVGLSPIVNGITVKADGNGCTGFGLAEDLTGIACTANTITLTADVTLTASVITIPAASVVTLDLQGHTLSSTVAAGRSDSKTAEDKATIVNHGTLAVIDTVGGGIVTNTISLCDALFNGTDGTATLNGGTFKNRAWYPIHNHGTMTINAGVTAGESGFYDTSPVMNGWGHDDGPVGTAVLTINGGTFIDGAHTIKNGDTNNAATLTINGGTFTQSNDTKDVISNRNNASAISITGGELKGAVTSATSSLTITGGKYSIDPTSFLPTGYTYVLVDNVYAVAVPTAPAAPENTSTTPGPFLITFLDASGNTVKVEWVEYGASATAPTGYGEYTGYTNVTENKDLRPIVSASSKYAVPNTADKSK